MIVNLLNIFCCQLHYFLPNIFIYCCRLGRDAEDVEVAAPATLEPIQGKTRCAFFLPDHLSSGVCNLCLFWNFGYKRQIYLQSSVVLYLLPSFIFIKHEFLEICAKLSVRSLYIIHGLGNIHVLFSFDDLFSDCSGFLDRKEFVFDCPLGHREFRISSYNSRYWINHVWYHA